MQQVRLNWSNFARFAVCTVQDSLAFLCFTQAVIYSRAKQGKPEGAAKTPIAEEDQQVNLAIERAKYKSFWVGVNRGISIDSKNPRQVEVLGKERKAAIERVSNGSEIEECLHL